MRNKLPGTIIDNLHYIILSLLNTATFVKWSLIAVFLIIMEMIRYERKREEDGTVKALKRYEKKALTIILTITTQRETGYVSRYLPAGERRRSSCQSV